MSTETHPTLDHQGLEVLDAETCWNLVAATPIGRVAFLDEGDPTILPITHRLDGRSVVFRTASGAKLHAAILGRSVAFEVDGADPHTRQGWSVLIRGVADTVHDALELSRLEEMELEPWADVVNRSHWVRIRADEITGRRIR